MSLNDSLLPDDVATLKAAVLAMQERCLAAEAEAARAKALNSNADALISHLKLEIEKLRRQLYGHPINRLDELLPWTYPAV